MTVTVIRSNYGKITMNSTTTAISSLKGEQSSLDIGSLKLNGSKFITPGLSTSVVNSLQNVSLDVNNLNLFDASDGNKQITDMAYSSTESIFVAVVKKGYPLYSSDGENWYRSNTNINGDYYECLRVIWVEELNKFFLAVKDGHAGTNGGGIWSSQDGKDWVKSTHYKIDGTLGTYYQGSPTTIAYSPYLNLFVAISDGNGVDRLWTSTGGTTFNEVAQDFLPNFSKNDTSYHFHSIIWNSVLNIFMIGLSMDGKGSSHDTFWYSSDSEALVWQQFTQVFDDSDNLDTSIQNLARLAYSPSLDVTVAVGRGIYYTSYGSGPANVANLQWHQTSTVNDQSGTTVDLLDVEWIEALGLFVATGNTNQPVMYSNNGSLWKHANVEVGSTGFLSQPKRSLTYGRDKLIISTNHPKPFIQSTETPSITTINASCTGLNDITDAGSGKIITDAERTKLNTLPEKITLSSGSIPPGALARNVDLNLVFKNLNNAINGSYFVGSLTVKYSAEGQTENIALYRGQVSYTGGASGDLSCVTQILQGTGTNNASMIFQSNIFTFNPSSTETYTYVITIQE